MTLRERATVTYQVTGTVAEVETAVATLRRHDQLVAERGWRRDPSGKTVVNVTVRAEQRRRRSLEVPLVVKVAVGSLPVAGAGGWVTGVLGADLIGQVVTVLGSALAAGFLLYALATVWHRVPGHHCPGCSDH